MKVLSIAHSVALYPSGRFRYDALVRLRPEIDLTLVVPSRWREFGRDAQPKMLEGSLKIRVEKIRLQALPRIKWYLHYYPRLHDILVEMRPDVIHLWEEPWSVVAWQAGRLRDRLLPRSALILETEQNILHRLPPPFKQIRGTTLKQTDLLIGRQPESLDVSRACGFDGPTAIVEYSVDHTVFRPSDRAAARDGLQARGLALGYVGRVVPEKGLDDVLAAMQASDRDITLYILGSGPHQERLLANAGKLGLGERVRVLEPRSPSGVAQFINGLDALVLMSRTTRTWKEQFGRVITEAHACGIPVIGSDSGAIPDVVADGGWIVKEGDIAGFAKLLQRLDDDRSEFARAGSAGLAQAAARFSAARVGTTLGDAFVKAWHARQQSLESKALVMS